MFTGDMLTAEDVQRLINRSANAMGIQSDAHESMHLRPAWGIEAELVSDRSDIDITNSGIFIIGWFVQCAQQRPFPLKGGDEKEFGRGNSGDRMDLSDPPVCNMHLAIARVIAASGLTDVFDRYEWDHYGEDLVRSTSADHLFPTPYLRID